MRGEMGPITTKVEIDLPRDQVFEQIADLAARPSFTEPYQSDFRLNRIESTGVGAAARFRTRPGGWAGTEITSVEAPHRLVEEGNCGTLNRVPTKTVWELVELPTGLTEVNVTFLTMPVNLSDRIAELRQRAASRHRRGWQDSLRRLRDQLESGSTTELETVRVAGADRLATSPSGTLAAI